MMPLLFATLEAIQGWSPIFHFLVLFSVIILLILIVIKPHYLSEASPLYLVDFSCFKPPIHCMAPFSKFVENASMISSFDRESVAFMSKILTSSGQSQNTYLPPALHYVPPKTHQRESLQEVQMALFPIVDTLNSSLTLLGSQIFPPWERLRYAFSLFGKRFIYKSKEVYVPDFRKVIDHFCLPTSGRAVIRKIGKGLSLGEKELEPALATLHRFGNQSSASLWYQLAYLEAKGRVRKGHKVCQLGMGSGPKSCSVVWECLWPIGAEPITGPWDESLDIYPDRAFLEGDSPPK